MKPSIDGGHVAPDRSRWPGVRPHSLATSDMRKSLRREPRSDRTAPRLLGVFTNWRLLAYGYTFPVFYAVFFLYLFERGLWLLNSGGIPLYHDFTYHYMAGLQALRGDIASLYDPREFTRLQEAMVGTGNVRFAIWPYPPPFLLTLMPFVPLPYVSAFLSWETVTLLAFVAVVYFIVRLPAAIALALASPFTAWNFLAGQSGFLTAALLGAALLFLERRPVVAGAFIGCLSYKPQFGVLFPIALIAANQWRVVASAAATVLVLVGVSIAAFGAQPWVMFPRELAMQAGVNLVGADDSRWELLQTVYGLVRYFNGGAALAWLVQGLMALAVAAIVWLVWRSRAHHALKAATLSAAALVATPYTLAYDLAAIAIPVAFLATDQIRSGLLRGEQTIMLMLFAAGLPILFTAGRAPLGAAIMLTLLCLILRRVIREGREPAYALETSSA
jgi:arabinofuranan 3-O-arabinosyltransferase